MAVRKDTLFGHIYSKDMGCHWILTSVSFLDGGVWETLYLCRIVYRGKRQLAGHCKSAHVAILACCSYLYFIVFPLLSVISPLISEFEDVQAAACELLSVFSHLFWKTTVLGLGHLPFSKGFTFPNHFRRHDIAVRQQV